VGPGASEKNSRRGTPVVVGRPPAVKSAGRGKNPRFLSKAVKEEIAKEEAEAAARAAEAGVDGGEDDADGEDGERDDPLLVKDEDGTIRKREIITCAFPSSFYFYC
jgi:hypothetical protein